MTPKKKGKQEEIASIRRLLADGAFKLNTKYSGTWASMCKAAADEAVCNCKLTAASLEKTKFKAFANLPIPIPSGDRPLQLAYPSLAFVVMKMYKTFDVKLGRAGRGNLNTSHCRDWVTSIEELVDHIRNRQATQPLQFIDQSYQYKVLTDMDHVTLKQLKKGSGQAANDDVVISDDDPIDVPDGGSSDDETDA